MSRPTSFEPVKAIRATCGSRTNAAPTTLPRPGRNCSASAGTPACQRVSHIARAMPGVWVEGLTIAVLPATSAAAVMPVQMARGKFQGLITAATPRGSYHCWLISPTNRPSRSGGSRAAAWRA